MASYTDLQTAWLPGSSSLASAFAIIVLTQLSRAERRGSLFNTAKDSKQFTDNVTGECVGLIFSLFSAAG